MFLVGCKPIDWSKKTYQDVVRYEEEIVKKVKPYIQSTEVYYHLSTYAHFDALFLTDDVRMLYVDYYTKHHHLSVEKESLMRARLLQENRYYISFYIMGSQPESIYLDNYALHTGRYQKQTSVLGDKDSVWQVALKIGDKKYIPDSIRVVDLPIEYQVFFGQRYSQFKSIYLVRFDATDVDEYEILPLGKHTVTLEFTSSRYDAYLAWEDIVYNAGIQTGDGSDVIAGL